MKRILGVVGSPRRNGNTHLLVSKLLEGAQGAGASTDTVFLNDLRIRECDGCHACWSGRPCSKNDDMNPLYARLIESDVIVFGTPVYWYGPTALMKGFIDRFVYFNSPENHAKIKGKPAALVVPYEEKSLEMGGFVVTFFEKCFQYLDMRLAGTILAPGVTRKGDVMDKPEFLEKAFELGRSLAS